MMRISILYNLTSVKHLIRFYMIDYYAWLERMGLMGKFSAGLDHG